LRGQQASWFTDGMKNPGSTPTNETCPKCGLEVVYNGNYFCTDWGLNDADCDWALPHPPTELVDKQISFRLVGYWEEELDSGNRLELHYEYPEA
jgi:hypothetical protein